MRTISEELERAEALTEEILKIIRGARAYLPVYSKEAIVELLVNSLRAPPSGEAGEVTDGMVGRAWEAYEAKSGYSKTERFRAALQAALLPTIKEPTDGK